MAVPARRSDRPKHICACTAVFQRRPRWIREYRAAAAKGGGDRQGVGWQHEVCAPEHPCSTPHNPSSADLGRKSGCIRRIFARSPRCVEGKGFAAEDIGLESLVFDMRRLIIGDGGKLKPASLLMSVRSGVVVLRIVFVGMKQCFVISRRFDGELSTLCSA